MFGKLLFVWFGLLCCLDLVLGLRWFWNVWFGCFGLILDLGRFALHFVAFGKTTCFEGWLAWFLVRPCFGMFGRWGWSLVSQTESVGRESVLFLRYNTSLKGLFVFLCVFSYVCC